MPLKFKKVVLICEDYLTEQNVQEPLTSVGHRAYFLE